MNESGKGLAQKTPWHLWVVGIFSLLWNAMGVLDYVMTMSKNEAYLSEFTQEQLDYFFGFPTWVVVSWTVAVWGSLLGSLLLLLRKRLAVPIFILAFAAMVVTTIYNFVLTNGLEMMGVTGAIFSAVIFVIALLLVIYARILAKRGVLK